MKKEQESKRMIESKIYKLISTSSNRTKTSFLLNQNLIHKCAINIKNNNKRYEIVIGKREIMAQK